MQLETLRPGKGVDLDALQALFKGRNWKAALPQALPDPILIALAKDLRGVEEYLCSEDAPQDCPAAMASAVLAITTLLSRKGRSQARHALQISEGGLMRAMQVYQWGIEREIVSRITGIATSIQSSNFVESLERCAAG